MIVDRLLARQLIPKLFTADRLAVDTETTGLRPFHGDKLFSLIIADTTDEYYFDHPDAETCKELEVLFKTCPLWFMHNASFDLDFLAQVGLLPRGKIHDTMVTERILFNEDMSYSLESVAKKYGYQKDAAVEEYLKEQKLYTKIQIPGKKTTEKAYHYDQVPKELIIPYAKRDARITYDIGVAQLSKLEYPNWPANLPNPKTVYENECRLIKTCFDMRQIGVKINRTYIEEAIRYESTRHEKERESFEKEVGQSYQASSQKLQIIFAGLGFTVPCTDKGNPQITDNVLMGISHPIAKQVLILRESYKRRGVFENLLYHADPNDIIHVNLRQSGTATGRFSANSPNLQNMEKEDESPFPIRRSFIPRSKDFVFVEIDYRALEFRLFVDYANHEHLAQSIQSGLDPHDETAKLVGICRRDAKTLNFAILYGAGAGKIADMLEKTYDEALALKQKYFAALPEIQAFINRCTKVAEKRGFIFNWLGRRSYFPNSTFSYKAANYLIQGGGADIVKLAMNRLTAFPMILQVHDSILFEMPKAELHKVKDIVKIMAEAYPAKILPMDVSVEWSQNNWQDLEEFHVTETRDGVSKESAYLS